jgi:flagellar biosynthesis component FlhA
MMIIRSARGQFDSFVKLFLGFNLLLDILIIIVCFYTSRTNDVRYPTPGFGEI